VAKKKSEKTPRQIAKEEAWKAFSTYIRTRDCIRFSGDPELGKCVTCNKALPFKKLQAGHFIQGRGNAVLFDDRLVYTQCVGCNGNPPFGKGGNYVEYFLFMLKEGYTPEELEEFNNLKKTTVKYQIHEFIELKEEFKTLTKELLKENKHGRK
jgi:predicted transcriptional regulator